jgi:glycosyltransferase involved in cell wall biosynthesis
LKKIVIIGPVHPYRGGIADSNQLLCESLNENGHDAELFTFTLQYPEFLFPGKTQYSESEAPENVKITRCINTMNPFNWIAVARKINKMKPDIVIVRYWMTFLAPCLGTLVKFVSSKITKIAVCDNVIPHENRMGDKLFTQYFANQFDGFVTMSDLTSSELMDFTKKPKTTIPLPIFTNYGDRIDKQEARKKLNLDADGKYLLFFGIVRQYKGLDLTLEAMSHLVTQDKDVKLLIVGEFYDPIEHYNELIAKYGIADNVIIVNNYVTDEEVPLYFSSSDMVIQTYLTASQSAVSQTAINFHTPVLVTDVGGLSEIVLHGKMGYVCNKDAKEISDCIINFFSENKYDEFSENVANEKHKYTWKSFSEKVIEFNRSLKQ